MSKKVIIEVMLGFVLLCLLVTGIFGVQAYKKPLAQPLSIVMSATQEATPVPAADNAATATPQPVAQAQPEKLCGMSSDMTILMIGRDENHWEPPYGADAIRMVKIDVEKKTVTVFGFQRDLFFKTPKLEETYAVKSHKLGPLYTVVTQKEGGKTPEADIKATNVLAQVLYDQFGIAPDHYLTVEEGVIPEIVDAIGGVEVDVKEDLNSSEISIQKGKHLMNGEVAVIYMRYLKDGMASEDEWGRLDRQSNVMRAIALKMLTPAVITKIPDVYKAVSENLVTDLSPEEILNLACVAQNVSIEQVMLKTFDREEMNIEKDESMLLKDPVAAKKLVQDFFK